MVEECQHRTGGQPGNQNARKHGFYSRVLDEAEQLDLERSMEIDGLDEEIALLRVKIKSLVERDPDNIKLIMRAVDYMGRLVRTKYNIGRNDRTGLKEAIGNILKDIALPVGMGIGNILRKG